MNGKKAKFLRKLALRDNLRYRKMKKVMVRNTSLYRQIRKEYDDGQI